MTGFADAIRSFGLKVEERTENVVAGCTIEVLRSIKVGSELTGAPGQPVGQYGPGYHPGLVGGTLRDSWLPERLGRFVWSVATNLVYAPPIENGAGRFGPLTLRSTIGGFHSVALTRANFDRIVPYVTARVAGGTP
jgi:hypothetical protein